MSILGSANYIIEERNDESCAAPNGVYVDNFDNLRRAIATTWSSISHRVTVKGFEVFVHATREGKEEKLEATYTFKSLPSVKLPDHF